MNKVIPFRDERPANILWPKLKLTSMQEKQWNETRAAALWALPFVTDIWYAMMVDSDGKTAWFTDQIQIAATDDTFMFLNPDTFFKYTLEERVFICAHEVQHCVFNHAGIMWRCDQENCVRYPDGVVLPFNHKLMNIAADCVINAMLIDSGINGLPKGGWYIPKIIPGSMSMFEAYRKLYKMTKKRGDGRRPGDRGGSGDKGDDGITLPYDGKSFDKMLRPGEGRGKTPNEAESERSPQQWINAINAAKESARAAGDLPENIERMFNVAMQPDIDWSELYGLAVSKALGRDALSWMYLDPEFAIRGIGFPGRVKFGCDVIVIVFDTSGSINQATMDHWAGITQGVIEQVKPQHLIVMECDATIHNYTVIEDIADLKGKAGGGGGTSFKPPFKRVQDEGLEPDALIYLTDLYPNDGYPDEPPFPVIWCAINDQKAPWGTTIKVPVRMEDA
jgi:predicted metal-dependent peptidase